MLLLMTVMSLLMLLVLILLLLLLQFGLLHTASGEGDVEVVAALVFGVMCDQMSPLGQNTADR